MSRKALAIAIIALWAGGLAWMLRRNVGVDVNRRLTEAGIRVQPATYYYTLSYRGEKIGAASSAIDTLVAALISEDYYTGRFPIGDSLVPVSARFRARLTRGFRLTDVSVQLDLPEKSSRLSAFVQGDTTLVMVGREQADSVRAHVIGLRGPLLTPTLVGMALVLAEPPKVGRSERFVVFDPVAANVNLHSLKIAAESLFTVVDSADRSASGIWAAAHSDTVRAWRLGGDTRALTIWVDAEGRLVAAGAPNGLALERTAYELAFERARAR